MAQAATAKAGSADQTAVRRLCHDISGPLTSIVINCELALEEDCPPPLRARLETVLAEAMHINQRLRESRSE